MQFARCKVRLSGDMGTVIEKAPVSPAEVALLKVIHGDDAVFEPKRGYQDPVTYPEEGFPIGEKLSRSSKFPLLWTSGPQS